MKKIFTAILVVVTTVAFAQIKTPQPSPLSKVEQKVGLTDFTVEYSRPSKKGRIIFGDLVPYGEMWRTGANASTKISFSTGVRIHGEFVPQGTYALYTIPGKTEWTIILHKNLSYWGTGGDDYKAEEDQLRFTVNPTDLKGTIETLTLEFANLTDESADLQLKWDNTEVTIPITVEFDDVVMQQIKDAMTISTGTYYTAARYYLDHDKDMEQALEWINKALEGGDKYWYLRQKALILAKLERYEEAIEVAKASKTLAAQAKNNGYVKMNEASIAEWSKK
jgi:hypothetical protein